MGAKWQAFCVGVFIGVATAVSGGAALAQSLPPPPLAKVIDDNGVNLISGSVSAPGAQFSIGTSASGIGISRSGEMLGSANGQANWNNYAEDNFTGVLNFCQLGNMSPGDGCPETNPSYSYMLVSYGGLSEKFALINGIYTPYDGAQGIFSCSGSACTFTLHDGTAVLYDTTITNLSQIVSRSGVATKVTKPDGEVITFTYASGYAYQTGIPTGLGRVSASSSLGWMVKSSPDRTYKLINTVSNYCSVTATDCNTLTAYPTITNAADALGNTWTGSLNATNGNITLTSPAGVPTVYAVQGYDPNFPLSGKVSSITRGSSTFSYGWAFESTHWPANSQPYGPVVASFGLSGASTAKSLLVLPARGFVLQAKDELGRATTTMQRDVNGNVTIALNPDATGISDPLPSGSGATGGFSTYAYDSRNNLTTVTIIPRNANGNTAVYQTSTATYQPSCSVTTDKSCNKPLTITDAAGVTTTYTYSTVHGGMLTETRMAVNGVQAQVRYGYAQVTPYLKDVSGNPVAQTPVWRLVSVAKCMTQTLANCAGTSDELKTIISYTSNPLGGDNTHPLYNNVLPVSTTALRGDGTGAITTTSAYDIFGNVTSVDGPLTGTSDTTYTFYDLDRRPTGSIGPDAKGDGVRQASRTTYNGDSKVITVETGYVTGTTQAALDAMSYANGNELSKTTTGYDTGTGLPVVTRVYDQTNALVKLVQTSYDAYLRVDCVAQRLNPAVFSNITATSACTRGADGPDGADRIVKYSYDAAGAVLKTTSGYGTSLARDDRVNVYFANNGFLNTAADAKGNLTTYEYDAFNRVVKTDYPSATAVGQSNTNDYDQTVYTGPRVSQIRMRDGLCLNFTYDAIGRVSTKVNAATAGNCTRTETVAESFSYNNFDKVTSHGNNGVSSGFGYDTLYGLTSEVEPLGTVSYGYDGYGRRSRLTWPGSFYVTYGYDNASRMTSIQENGSATIATFAYDNYGRRQSLNRGNGVVTTFGYDYQSRLSGLCTDVAAFSDVCTNSNTQPAGDDVRTVFTYTQANQLAGKILQAPNAAYQFTHALVAQTVGYTINGLNQVSTAGGSTMSYDLKGNLFSDGSTTYTYNANNLLAATSAGAALSYDAENRLATISRNLTTTGFLYDGTDLIAEYNGTTLLRRYVHGPVTDDPVLWYEGTTTSDKRYITFDNQGSVIGYTDASGNTKLDAGGAKMINAYDEYGVPKAGNQGRFAYTGQTWLPEVGLYYYKARLYSPTLGRFMQTDPIGYKDGMNWYAYVADDPTDRSDATGTQTVPPSSYGWTDDQYRAVAQANSDMGAWIGDRSDEIGTALMDPNVEQATMDTSFMAAVVFKDVSAIFKMADFIAEDATKLKGMQNPTVAAAVQNGRQAHKDFQAVVDAKPGWKSEPTLTGTSGAKVKPDAVTGKKGYNVELKPNTPSGRAKGAAQVKRYERETNRKGRVVCYDPVTRKLTPCG